MRNHYLTKSKFKIALECVRQLYYTGKPDEYADKNLEDEFLLALSKGGYQVGELAKYYFCEDPVKELISIKSLEYDIALAETQKSLELSDRVVISEAAFSYENLFVRVDFLVRDGKVLNIYEVKAKSYDLEEKILSTKNPSVASKWVEYLYDIAFQRYVITNALIEQGFIIKTHLLLVNKDATTDIDGMHQLFKVYSDNGKIKVIARDGLKRKDIGTQILIPIPTNDICDKIENDFPVPTDFINNISFKDFIWRVAEIYAKNEKIISTVGSKCKACNFYTNASDTSELRSGFVECWTTAIGSSKIDRLLVTELWNGLSGPRSYANELARSGKYFIHSIEESDIAPSTISKNKYSGLTPHLRRMEQINREKNRTSSSYFDVEGIKSEMDSWTFPLHIIDFETSAVAVPFFKGLRPYEGVAFQFSHHTIDKDWNIRHQSQFLSFEPNSFPNYDFVRNLKNALSKDHGSIFRYHNHENTYLNMIYRQLLFRSDSPHDKLELLNFIADITQDKIRGEGKRNMIDLYKLVLQYYYSPLAKGSNSLKQILPAIIAESEFLKNKYSKSGVYGKDKLVPSLNFDDHIWIGPEAGNNPYKTLPRVFENYDQDTLDMLVKDMDELADGGTAMTAYNYLQFSEIPKEQRNSICEALLKYCELDTFAMVMLLEGWRDKLS
jgi:hypothetical protein